MNGKTKAYIDDDMNDEVMQLDDNLFDADNQLDDQLHGNEFNDELSNDEMNDGLTMDDEMELNDDVASMEGGSLRSLDDDLNDEVIKRHRK